MAAVDVVIVLLAIGALLLGWSRGFLVGASTLVGFILGLVLGRLLAGPVAELLVSTDIVHDRNHPAAEVLFPLLLAVACSVGLGLLGAYLRTKLTSPSGRGLDATGGALSSIIATLLVIWLAAGWIRTTPFLQPNRWVADSAIVAAMDRMLPITSTEALGTLGTALADNGFPQVFEGQRERIRGVGEPNPAMVDVGRQVDGSVVKVVTSHTECGRLQEGTGWVYGDGLVATNAHVVAGAQSLTVQIAGTGEPYNAEVVAFDPGTDAAVLRVPDLPAPALELGSDLGAGADSVLVGFPENGPYTISPARVREQLSARGLDIYNEDSVTRDIYSVRGIVRSGNSGGPLLDAEGRVVGMVFARSATEAETGYALTLDEIDGILRRGQQATAPVSTDRCAEQVPQHQQQTQTG
ncbi:MULTISPECIES: MarP family serine protease [Brevibacterium]|uniref:MarP family serine protease n=1 Tax=Brevibacterium TaxID=1696 RepID=UPI0021AFFED9|nr:MULTISPECIES: MarP family serine protease [Brevibacterium]MCT1828751.1 MarP family serine protease [Brevibacterium luteolum]